MRIFKCALRAQENMERKINCSDLGNKPSKKIYLFAYSYLPSLQVVINYGNMQPHIFSGVDGVGKCINRNRMKIMSKWA